MWRKCLALVLIAISALGLTLLWRAFDFKAQEIYLSAAALPQIPEESLSRLVAAVRIPTVSTEEEIPADSFEEFKDFLQRSYPRVFSALSVRWFNQYALLLTWPGSQPELEPILLLSHSDVVPVEPGTQGEWSHPPFSAAIADGFIWGRGTWDDKSSLIAQLEAIDLLLTQGKSPRRTIVLAVGHDEETGGRLGAQAIASYLTVQGEHFSLILDEGSMIYKPGVIRGVKEPAAMIGIAEKGYLTLELAARGEGGHSSMPPHQTAVGRLAAALTRLQQQPLPAELNTPVRQMYQALGPHMPLLQRLALANLWLFEPLVLKQMTAQPSTNAYVRTTVAPTMLSAGVKDNVLAQEAKATINLRLAPGATADEVMANIEKIIADDQVTIKVSGAGKVNPSPVASTDSWAYLQVLKSIRQARPDVLVAPSLLFGATDSRHYLALSDHVLRFTPISIELADASRIHGTDERISLQDFAHMIAFYYQLLLNTSVLLDEEAG